MKGIAAAILVFEAIVALLGGLYVASTEDVSGQLLWSLVGLVVVLCIAGAGTMRRGRTGWIIGSAVQVLVLMSGVVIPVMFVLGAVFALLWIMAYVLGRRIEQFQQAASAR